MLEAARRLVSAGSAHLPSLIHGRLTEKFSHSINGWRRHPSELELQWELFFRYFRILTIGSSAQSKKMSSTSVYYIQCCRRYCSPSSVHIWHVPASISADPPRSENFLIACAVLTAEQAIFQLQQHIIKWERMNRDRVFLSIDTGLWNGIIRLTRNRCQGLRKDTRISYASEVKLLVRKCVCIPASRLK